MLKSSIDEVEMDQLLTFCLLSAVIVFISRASLRRPGSHGFYRFFAWEAILGLFVLNVNLWFHHPLAWNQMISWVLLVACLIPLAFGIHNLVTRGKPVRLREGEPQLLSFEKTSALVTSGIFHYIRHPLYSSLLLLAWGIFFKAPSWSGALLALASSALLFATARADEVECLRFFGEEYRDYMRRTRRFIPFLF
jgi:protein-S-isoprenylcysteine O-methyltransferase Ste14